VITVAFLSTHIDGDGVPVEYVPASRTADGGLQPAMVTVHLVGSLVHVGFDLTEVRELADKFASVVMLHDAAEQLAAEKAVA
jgi:hypothetical protein